VFNLDYLREISSDNDAFVNSIISLFLKDLPHSISLINDAIKEKDFKSLKLHAHKLKSSLRALGANNIAEICAAIEAEALAENSNNAIALKEKLETLLEDLTKSLYACIGK
jgi:HPt (histidine-containing phosphotransfer) domain-containing protein